MIETKPLTAQLGIIKVEPEPDEDQIGLAIGAQGNGTFMEFECCQEPRTCSTAERSSRSKLTDRMVKKSKLKFLQDKGHQNIESFENEPKFVLSAKIGAAPFEQAGMIFTFELARRKSWRSTSCTRAGGPAGAVPRRLQCDVLLMGDASDRPPRASELLEQWFAGEDAKTLGSLNDRFGRGAFAVAFVLLLAVPALPLPTGGATHVLEVIAMLLALQLVVGREEVWLPERFRRMELAGERQQRFIERLMRLIRRLERISRPRARFLFRGRASNVVFGLLVLVGSLGAFLAPPFTGLDTLPSLGVVLLSLGVILEDALVAIAGVVVVAAGVVLEIVLGSAVVHGVSSLF